MSLRERIQADLTAAMKSRDAQRASALRLIRAEILNLEKAGRGEPTDETVVQALQRMVRQRNESIEQYRLGKREDLAAKEQAELAVIRSYLPETVSDEEIAAAVGEAAAALGASSLKDMGRVMGAAMKKLKETGKAVEGARVSEAAKKALGG